MSDQVIEFAILGAASGSAYALMAVGLVLVYRGSGVVNFAHGAIGMAGAYAFWEAQDRGLPVVVAIAVGVLASAVLGLAVHLLVMRPLRYATGLVRVVATLALLVTLQAGAYVLFTSQVRSVTPFLPTGTTHLLGTVVPSDRLWTVGVASLITAALWAAYRFTRFGLATSAVAESEVSAEAIGIRPTIIAGANWMLGGALAAAAGILLAPIAGIQVAMLTLLVVPALGAAIAGNMVSIPIAFLTGLGISVIQSEIGAHTSSPGLATAVPALAVMVLVVVRGRALPLRSFVGERLPRVGTGEVTWVAGAAILLATFLLALVLTETLVVAIIVTLVASMILLSLVVVTGYAGQISLAQYALAGVGALVSARLVADAGFDVALAILVGMLATLPVGLLVGIPSLRTRGITLAIATLALASAFEALVFGNLTITGGFDGLDVSGATFFSVTTNAFTNPEVYAVLTLGCFAAAALCVANLRRSRIGHQLLAVRANERAASSLGVSLFASKLYAFAVAGMIAGLGGGLLAFLYPSTQFTGFTTSASISAVSLATIGGIGYVVGPLFGGQFQAGGIGTQVSDLFGPDAQNYLVIVGGVVTIIILLTHRDGMADVASRSMRELSARFLPRRRRARKPSIVLAEPRPVRVPPASLELSGVTVDYGGVRALDGVSVRIGPGEIVGVIGPNGAGKTTLIDAITGFARPTSGDIELDGTSILRWSVRKRALAGVGRLFQGLELFEDMSVLDNLLVAANSRSVRARAYVTDPFVPRRGSPTAAMVAAIREFGLEPDLDKLPKELSHGRRRLAGIARTAALNPSILLLDEPSGGLSDARSLELTRLVRRLAEEWGMGIMLIAHDMEMVMSLCDRVCVLHFGKVIAEGPPSEIGGDRKVVEAYLGSPAEETGERERSSTVSGAAPVPASDVRARAAVTRRAPRQLEPAGREPLVQARGVATGYLGQPVLTDLELEVHRGEVVALLGPNRAGKTTTLLTLAGVLEPLEGEVWFDGAPHKAPLHRRARAGLGFVADQHSVFRKLSVGENLRVGRSDPAVTTELFPQLAPLMRREAGLLSGGEQQMLALGRFLARDPSLLMVDELSLGLAPMIVSRLHDVLRQVADQGVGVIVVEQHVKQALRVADRVYVLGNGSVVLQGRVSDIGHLVEEAVLEHALGEAPQPGQRTIPAPR